LFNTSAIRAPLRIDASNAKLNQSFDLNNIHRILSLEYLPYDIFHLIGHSPSDVAEVYASLGSDSPSSSHPIDIGTTSHTGKASSSVPHTTTFHTIQDSTKRIHVHSRTSSLRHHASFLYDVFSTLSALKCSVVKIDGMRLIEAMDVSILLESSTKAA